MMQDVDKKNKNAKNARKVLQDLINSAKNKKDDPLFDESIIEDDSFYSIHIKQLNLALQVELEKYNLPILLRLVALKAINPAIDDLNKSGNLPVRIWSNQIETMAEVIAKLIEDPSKSMVLIGATQLGKTMTVILCWVAEAILAGVTKQRYKVLFIQPGRTSLRTQMEDDLKIFRRLYDFEIERKSNLGKVATHSEYRTQTNNILRLGETEDVPVFARTKGIKKALGDLKKVIEIAHAANTRIILVVDECHWGMGEESIMKTILEFAKDLTTKAEGDLMIAISATPFQLSELSSLNQVRCRTYKGYVGYSFWQGEMLDPRYPLIIPTIISFSNSEAITDVKLDLIDRRCYYSEKHFNKLLLRITHAQYKDFCENLLIKFVNNLLVHKNPLKGRGVLLRFFKRIEEIEDFFNRKGHLFHVKIKLVPWNGDNSSKELVKYLEELGVADDDLKLIMLNGNGRMGNRISDESGICYGYDAAHTTTLAALLQGVIGRLTGKKSIIPMIFLAQQHCDLLDRYVESLGLDLGDNPHEHVSRTKKTKRADSITLFADNQHAKMFQNINVGYKFADIGLADVEDFTANFADQWWKDSESLKGPRMSNNRKMEFWEKWNSIIPEIEKALNLNPGDIIQFTSDENTNSAPFVDSENYSYDGTIGFRKATATSVTNSNLKSDRIASGSKKGKRRLQPQMHLIRRKNGRTYKWWLVAIKLRLQSDMVFNQNVKFLPNQKSVFYHPVGNDPSFLSEEDKE